MGIEYSDRRVSTGSAGDVLASLARAAGLTTEELLDDIRSGGRDAAFRRYAQKAETRKGAVSARRRQIELLARRNYG